MHGDNGNPTGFVIRSPKLVIKGALVVEKPKKNGDARKSDSRSRRNR